MNISGREMLTNKTAKAPVEGTTSQQVDGGATAKDGEVAGANLVAAVAAETTAKVAAVMEEKMSMISKKLDIITAKLESESQRIEEVENRISSAEDIIADLEGRLANTENKLAALTNRMDDQEARSPVGGYTQADFVMFWLHIRTLLWGFESGASGCHDGCVSRRTTVDCGQVRSQRALFPPSSKGPFVLYP